ncbi:MAG: sodium/proton-translocating pyrophosphatase, partial [Acidobacteriota bacterium]|nr:sodium/proton-translocating pyrophosphatase [Acidobacteriota bacterium]
AGGAWDNAKKVVEVDLKQKNTPLHDAAVVGDTVGDPFKDTSSVALNPVIKFTTLFGLLAVELAVKLSLDNAEARPWLTPGLSLAFFMVSVVFVWRSFYTMRIGAVIADEAEKESNELRGAGDRVSLNPQPEPPGIAMPGVTIPADEVSLNPQPEPPGVGSSEE